MNPMLQLIMLILSGRRPNVPDRIRDLVCFGLYCFILYIRYYLEVFDSNFNLGLKRHYEVRSKRQSRQAEGGQETS